MKKVKMIFSVCLTFILMFSSINVLYAEDEKIPIDVEWLYTVSDDGTNGTIVGCSEFTKGNELTIPEEIDGIKITSLDRDLDIEGNLIRELVHSTKYLHLPDTITYIGDFFFDNEEIRENYSIEEMNLPSKIEYIGEYSFCDNENLTITNNVFPETLKYIGEGAFKSCYYNFDNGVLDLSNTQITELSADCFDVNEIEKILFPANLTLLQGLGGNNIQEISIPNSVNTIGYGALQYNPLKDVKISDSVTAIEAYAFSNCEELTSIRIPNSVRKIGLDAFFSTGLENGEIPDSVIDYGGRAFRGCDKITSITLPDSFLEIPDGEFSGCENLTQVNISNSITSIGSAAFEDCYSLKNFEIPDSVSFIGYNAFKGCKSIEKLTIPKGVLKLDHGTLADTPNLISLTFLNPYIDINSELFIYDKEESWNDSLIIYGYLGSTAQDFAEEKGIEFRSIGDIPPEIEEPDPDPDPDPEDPEETTDGFLADKHGWRIVNTKLGFGHGTSIDEGFDLANSALWAPFKNWTDPDLIKNATDYFNALLNNQTGRCFGLSALAIAQYNGDVDLNTYFDRVGNNLNEFGYEDTIYFDSKNYPGYIYTLNGNIEAVNVIDKFHALQHSFKLSQAEVYKDGNVFGQLLDYLYNSEERKPILVTFSADTGKGLMSHAVVIETGKEPTHYTETDTYFVPCYDPNTPKIEDNLEGASSLYNEETPGLEIDLNNDCYRFIWNYGNGYESTAWTDRDMWGGLLKSINFYDLSLLDDSIYEEKFELDTNDISQILFSGKGISINDSNTGKLLFEAENSENAKLGLYDESLDCNPIYTGIENNYLGYRFGMDSSGKVFTLNGENELISLYKKRAVFIQANGDIQLSFDEENQKIEVVSASNESQIKIMISSQDGSKYVETDGTLNEKQELILNLSDDSYSLQTDADDGIHSIYVENDEIIDENFHDKIDIDDEEDTDNSGIPDKDDETTIPQSPSTNTDSLKKENIQKNKSVKTGDNENIGLFSFICLFTGIAAGYIFLYKNKKSKHFR
ncbi:MAG: leucine-rich repeat protein [Thomasclavelia sp.]